MGDSMEEAGEVGVATVGAASAREIPAAFEEARAVVEVDVMAAKEVAMPAIVAATVAKTAGSFRGDTFRGAE